MARAGCASQRHGFANQFLQLLESGERIRAEINADGAPPTRRKGAEIAERLRLLQGTESVRLPRDRQVRSIRRRDLDKDARIRPALV